MATTVMKNDNPAERLGKETPLGVILRLVALAIIDAVALWFLAQLIRDGVWFLTVVIIIITLGINLFYLRKDLYPFRWFSPGLALMLLMVAYPTIYTIYIAFTNNSDGHLLTREQAIRVLESRTYLPEDAVAYDYTAFRSEDGTDYLLWLTDADGNTLVGRPGQPLTSDIQSVPGLGALDEDGVPESIAGFEKLNRISAAADTTLPTIQFGQAPDIVGVEGRRAGRFEQKYVYDAAQEVMVDQETATVYRAIDGTFTSETGETLIPGYYVTIGLRNFERFFNSSALSGPLLTIFIWTVMHAFSAVFLTFTLGLALALVLNSDLVPAKKVLRSLILIPYAIPAFISVLIWRGLFSEQLGLVNGVLRSIFGEGLPWTSDATWARIAILFIQLWLGFPYMALICSGALQAIPSEIYEAAEVDGANSWQRFWNLTLPLLLVAIGPLLIASFAFNFNNFTVLRLYNRGNPPIPDTATPAGYTDILITYTYRLAFAGGRGADYGYAAAITIVIFILVAALTLFNFRFTKVWEEVSESV